MDIDQVYTTGTTYVVLGQIRFLRSEIQGQGHRVIHEKRLCTEFHVQAVGPDCILQTHFLVASVFTDK